MTLTSTPRPNASLVGRKFTVVDDAVVRADFAMASELVGKLEPGATVVAIQAEVNERGVTRIHFNNGEVDGWASMNASDGSTLLQLSKSRADYGSDSDEESYYSTVESVSTASSGLGFLDVSKQASKKTDDDRIVDACATKNLKGARVILKAMIREGTRAPASESISAMITASLALPQTFKLMQYTLSLPLESMPSPQAVVSFVSQCKREGIDVAAVGRVEALLTEMHEAGFRVDKRVKRAFKDLRNSAEAAAIEPEPEPDTSEKGAELAQKSGQLQPFIAVFPQDCMGQLASFGPT
jgi:hypothetical protein